MKVTITLNDINAFGPAWQSVQDKTYGKITTQVYDALSPFIDLTDRYRKARQNYIKEHTPEGKSGIPRYDHTDQNGEQLSEEQCRDLGLPETDEWIEFQRFLDDLLFEEHEIKVKPVLDDKAANKLPPKELRVFDVLGLRVRPRAEHEEEDDDEEDEEDEE